MLSGVLLQLFYGFMGSWTAYLISVLYVEYRTRKEKEGVSFKNHVIQVLTHSKSSPFPPKLIYHSPILLLKWKLNGGIKFLLILFLFYSWKPWCVMLASSKVRVIFSVCEITDVPLCPLCLTLFYMWTVVWGAGRSSGSLLEGSGSCLQLHLPSLRFCYSVDRLC